MYVDASSRNGTLGTPQFAPPKWESLKTVLQKVLNITFLKHFSYFFKKVVQLSIHFYAFWAIPVHLMYLMHSHIAIRHFCIQAL